MPLKLCFLLTGFLASEQLFHGSEPGTQPSKLLLLTYYSCKLFSCEPRLKMLPRKMEKVSAERQDWVKFFQPPSFQPVMIFVLPICLRWREIALVSQTYSLPVNSWHGCGQGPLCPEPSPSCPGLDTRNRHVKPVPCASGAMPARPFWQLGEVSRNPGTGQL